ncbi:hypothetical protein FNF27_03260 [Cafeteria roenbergensis]|uniref:Uncharacterized protein n=1 Tax=Cafeteria roenbergensis TaxID=33653 RepID=A0A5A8CHA3_CAFRO|nr:hypothetical protein FNF29_04270 [Cafeteria roenbergensis]KAA0162909.1 hypothetical protein FNF28_04465 [Cafeteria roenbergensis]KAA0164758.1 hypothetical protein FNF31_02295 [Cafeteria roenbergensis]KAA0175252.1 hypothetical protein FNF27_03260 [Cafeteria roenbergensis]|eukprot:KAA0151864.1 hypothetical protein FNF29_04270 [Cafeteria roenbergensis]
MGTSVAGAAAYATTVVVGTLVFVALVWTALWFGVLRNIKEVRYVLTGEGPESTGRRSGRRRHREPAGSTGSHAKAS